MSSFRPSWCCYNTFFNYNKRKGTSNFVLFLTCICQVGLICQRGHVLNCCSDVKSYLTTFDTIDCSTPGFSVLHFSQNLLKLIAFDSVMPSIHLILCCPLLFLPSIFPSIRVFTNESVLCIRWQKYWSFNFSILNNDS